MANTHSTPPLSDPPTPNEPEHDSPGSMASLESIDPALLDEEENPLEEGIADNIVAPSKQQYATGGAGYNSLKTHEGQLYAGMAVGGSHTWNYEPGTWKETKEEPDRWRIDYQTKKLRARNAPKGSGAPVGTEYHWLIVGHQVRGSPKYVHLHLKRRLEVSVSLMERIARAQTRCELVRNTSNRIEVQISP